jgi:hypothetical protein
MSYFDFLNKINKNEVKTIFELGSRDLVDGIKLLNHFEDSKVYAFECNTDCLVKCNQTLLMLEEDKRKRLVLVDKAVSITDGDVTLIFHLEIKMIPIIIYQILKKKS